MESYRLIVRGFAYEATEDDLRAIFEEHTDVLSVTRPVDHITGKPRDFAIVEVPTHAKALEAIHRVHGHVVNSHRLRVKLAEEHEMGEDGLLLESGGSRPEPHVAEQTPHKPERYLGRSTQPRGNR
jgi:RNA recognition motif-containing protein